MQYDLDLDFECCNEKCDNFDHFAEICESIDDVCAIDYDNKCAIFYDFSGCFDHRYNIIETTLLNDGEKLHEIWHNCVEVQQAFRMVMSSCW